MKIKSIEAFPIRARAVAAPDNIKSWAADAEVAGPMSRYPRFKPHRKLWRPTWPDLGCLVTAEDGTLGPGHRPLCRAGEPDHQRPFRPAAGRRIGLRHREAVGHDEPHGLALRRRRARQLCDQRRRPGAVGPQGQAARTGRSTSSSAARRATRSSATPPATTPTGTWSWAFKRHQAGLPVRCGGGARRDQPERGVRRCARGRRSGRRSS